MARKDRRRERVAGRFQDIPGKANKILNIILVALILVVLRVWHLSVVQYDYYLEQAKKPQKRTVIEPAVRGTIRDRFNIPLAVNKVQYNAAILYSQIQQVPSAVWEKDPSGKKVRRFKRKEHITDLSKLLADELGLNSERLEDLIHSKASFFGHLPFIVKENISEESYYRLKFLEKDWAGLHVQCVPQRHYPLGKVACGIVGYMGAISREQYDAIITELRELEAYVQGWENGEDPSLPSGIAGPNEAMRRIYDLREKAYTINDYVGKAGVESRFEEALRGFYGKTSYYSDAKGNYLRELPGAREPLSGQRILLSISSELQEYAEKLLAQNESFRIARVSGASPAVQAKLENKEQWIKGGAIVAMDPSSGEVLCMASYPRFDPNDFIPSGAPEVAEVKRANVRKWFETEGYIADIWHGKRMLEREVYDSALDTVKEEEKPLDWDQYLKMILPDRSEVKYVLTKVKDLQHAVEIQETFEELMRIAGFYNAYAVINYLYPSPLHKTHGKKMRVNDREEMEDNLERNAAKVSALKSRLDPYLDKLQHNYDKILAIDLCRLSVSNEKCSKRLLDVVGKKPLREYFEANGAYAILSDAVKEMSKTLFHDLEFDRWRKENQKTYLKEMRAKEKANHQYAKPYLDYLDEKERNLFGQFWEARRWSFILAMLKGHYPANMQEEEKPYFDHFIAWHNELEQGAHAAISWRKAYDILCRAAESLSDQLAVEYLASLRRYNDLDRGLLGTYRYLRNDEGVYLEKHLAAAFYPRYGNCFASSHAYRNATVQGSVFKLVTAYEGLSQQYKKINHGPVTLDLLNPFTIEDRIFKKGKDIFYGIGTDQKPLTPYYKGGRLIRSLSSNNGIVDLLKALEVSSNPYFSILAAEYLENPDDLGRAARDFSYGSKTGIDLPAEAKGNVPDDIDINRTGLYAMAIGQHTLTVTPLQTAVMLSALANGGKVLKPKIVHMIAGERVVKRENSGAVGIDVPFAVGAEVREKGNKVEVIATEVKKEVPLPPPVRNMLLEGMQRVNERVYKRGIWDLTAIYKNHPEAMSDFIDMEGQMVAKTSTGEVMENIDLDIESGTNIYNHLWYGGIVFEDSIPFEHVYKDKFGNPELVVVVYLRYGSYGKDTAPLAAQVASKWRQIKNNITGAKS